MASTDPAAQLSLLLDLEARHAAVLKDLEALEQRVEKTLAECLLLRKPVAEAA